MGARGELRVGTSGRHCDHWEQVLYPQRGLEATERLAHYATCFDAVEINSTFYGLPSWQTLAAWRDRVPRRFTFAVKASRYITHMTKLRDCGESLWRLFDLAGRTIMPTGPRRSG
ncbi:MAG: DUF72 domain-containing protein [Candidatus Eiseniibacteriota bacterium]|jgi:uncharacterized protein YecE (DUF72 family)